MVTVIFHMVIVVAITGVVVAVVGSKPTVVIVVVIAVAIGAGTEAEPSSCFGSAVTAHTGYCLTFEYSTEKLPINGIYGTC